MKANQHSLLTKDTRAQVGIGTMIVFIATILVAATAAAVLIDTSGKLQERSSQTGSQATDQVASNLVVKGVYGARDDSTGPLTTLNVTVALAPGAKALDLEQVKILITDGEKRVELDHSYNSAGLVFVHSGLRDPGETINTVDSAVMTAGALVNLQINMTVAGMELDPRSAVSVAIIPEVGSTVHADFITPASYGTDKIVVLR